MSAGNLHILVGRQGGGKSTFAAWLTAQVTTGRAYPDDPNVREQLNVATLSLEEADDRLVARLHAAGADVRRVQVLSDVLDTDDEGPAFTDLGVCPRIVDCWKPISRRTRFVYLLWTVWDIRSPETATTTR